MAASGAVKSLELYLDDALKLKTAIEANKGDTEFSRDGKGTIVYVLDTNIFVSFIAPAENSHHLSVFSRWLTEDVLIATSTMTAEFIFSGSLPGQQRNPVLMSPEHYEEAIAHVHRVERELNQEISRLSRSPETRSRLDVDEVKRLASVLRDPNETRDAKTAAVARQLPPAINRLVQNEWAAAVQAKRLLREPPILARIDSERWFDSSLLPDTDLTLNWYTRLRRFRPGAPPTPQRSRIQARYAATLSPPMTRLINDAMTLAMMELLTRRSAVEQTDQPPLRYVFVTADGAIRQAVEEFLRSPEGIGLPDFTRHIRDFVPLLNLSAIAVGHREPAELERRRELFSVIQSSIDELLVDTVELGTQLPRHALKELFSYVGALNLAGGRSSKAEISEQIDELKGRWSNSAALAIGLATPFLRDRDNSLFSELAAALEDRSLVGDVLSGLAETLQQLRERHAAMMFRGSFVTLRRTQGQQKDRTTKLRPRAPLLLLNADFTPFIGSQDRHLFFEEVSRGEIPREQIEKWNKTNAHPALKHLFNSCLFICVEMWTHGDTHARAALAACSREEHSKVDIDEILYCYALTRRFTMTSQNDHREALELLDRAISRTRYSFSDREYAGTIAARARSERAALQLFALYRSFLAPCGAEDTIVDIGDDNEVRRTFSNAIEDLHHVSDRWLEDNEAYPTGKDGALFLHRLKLQVYTNICGAWIFNEIFVPEKYLPPVTNNRERDLAELIAVMEDDTSMYGSASKTAILNEMILSFLEAKDGAREVRRDHAITTLREWLQTPPAELLPIDRREYEFLLGVLEKS